MCPAPACNCHQGQHRFITSVKWGNQNEFSHVENWLGFGSLGLEVIQHWLRKCYAKQLKNTHTLTLRHVQGLSSYTCISTSFKLKFLGKGSHCWLQIQGFIVLVVILEEAKEALMFLNAGCLPCLWSRELDILIGSATRQHRWKQEWIKSRGLHQWVCCLSVL